MFHMSRFSQSFQVIAHQAHIKFVQSIFECFLYFSTKDKKGSPEKRGDIETAHDTWEDLSVVADNTVYPENVLLASGIASVNSLAFAGTIPGKRNSAVLEGSVASKGIKETPSWGVRAPLFPCCLSVYSFLPLKISENLSFIAVNIMFYKFAPRSHIFLLMSPCSQCKYSKYPVFHKTPGRAQWHVHVL